jgi:large repetitive protein
MKKVVFTSILLALVLVMAAPVAAMADTTTISVQAANAPTVTEVSPSGGDVDSAVSVTITGTDFVVGETATVAFSGSGITPSSVTVTDNTTITATFTIASDAPAGAQDVTVTQLGKSGTASGAFTVNGFITVDSPASINLGYLTAGEPKNGSVSLTNLVTTNSATWSVEVKDATNGGFLRDGSSNALGPGKFQINKVAGPYIDSDTGFSYAQTDGTSPTLYYSQAVPANPTAGAYSIVLTFAGSY